jgi:hypothetical protein
LKCNSVLKFLSFIFLSIIISCKSAPVSQPAENIPDSSQFIKNFFSATNTTHIIVGGSIMDPSGNVVARTDCRLCVFEPEGHSVIYKNNALIELDEKLKVLWALKPVLLQHVLSKSLLADDFLALTSEYTVDAKFGNARYDNLKVIKRGGKIKKSFSFLKYFKENPELRPEPVPNLWSVDDMKNKSVEFSHGNSLIEIFDDMKNIQTFKGYAYYSLLEKKLYFFNKSLTKILRVIPAEGRALHSVQQYDNENLIAYANFNDQYGIGSVQLINLKTGAFSSLYNFTDDRQLSHACSSVQFFAEGKLFLVHSPCSGTPKQISSGYYFEFVDLKSGKNAFLHIAQPNPPQGGRLANMNDYLLHVKN